MRGEARALERLLWAVTLLAVVGALAVVSVIGWGMWSLIGGVL